MAMPKNKNKPTIKQLAGMIGALVMQLEQLKLHVFNGDKALDEYIKMKDDKEEFVKYLEKNYSEDDKDKEKTEGE